MKPHIYKRNGKWFVRAFAPSATVLNPGRGDIFGAWDAFEERKNSTSYQLYVPRARRRKVAQ
jgi:hypothetical protein